MHPRFLGCLPCSNPYSTLFEPRSHAERVNDAFQHGSHTSGCHRTALSTAMDDHRQSHRPRSELRRENSERLKSITAIHERNFIQLEKLIAVAEDWEASLQWGLCYCCQHGLADAATWFLENGASPSCKLRDRLHPILIAAHRRQKDVLRTLLAHGAEITAKGHRGRNALMYARDPETVEMLLNFGAQIDHVDEQGSTPLMRVLLDNKDMRIANLLIKKGAKTDTSDKRGRTLLMQSVWKNQTAFVQELIDGKVNLGHKDNQQRNVFHHFAMDLSRIDEVDPAHRRRKTNPFPKQSELIKTLIKADSSGRLMDAQDQLGRTPLHWAAMSGNSEFVRVVLEHSKASVNVMDKRQQTPLHLAAVYHHTKCMRALLENGANVNVKTREGLTPLHIACSVTDIKYKDEKPDTKSSEQTPEQHGIDTEASEQTSKQKAMGRSVETTEQSTIAFLIEKGADIYILTRRKQSVLHLAAEAGNWSVLEYLLGQLKNQATDRDENGNTPLHYACMSPTVEARIIELLINEYKADPGQCTKNGKTSLHLAAQAGNWDVAKCLLEKAGMDFTRRDDLGNTALHYAASHRNWASKGYEIVDLFSPWRWSMMMDQDAVDAAKESKAHIMDFRTGKTPTLSRQTVYDLLYAEHEAKEGHPAIRITPSKRVVFRWIHLPVNNLTWCLDLLTKDFIENKAMDFHTFTALERSFNHQHKGLELHARYMTPLCHAILPTSGQNSDAPQATNEPVHRTRLGKDEAHSSSSHSKGTSQKSERRERKLAKKKKEKKHKQSVKQDHDRKRKQAFAQDENKEMKPGHDKAQHHATDQKQRKPDAGLSSTGCMYLFTPYLHYETLTAREGMSRLAREVSKPDAGGGLIDKPGASHLRAHLSVYNRFPLHMRRTLDQYFYHNINTKDRDVDQVVHRYQKRKKVPRDQVRILMVDQLWMWVLHDNLIVTSFPQSWSYRPTIGSMTALTEGKDDIWDDIRDLLLNSNRPDVANVHELATFITGRCFSAFDRQRLHINEESLQFLDMFEAELGSAIDKETTLFQKFHKDVKRVEKWFEEKKKSKPEIQTSISNLFGIRFETKLLTRIKDIIDELDMLSMIFDCQLLQVLPDMQQAMKQIDNRKQPAATSARNTDSIFLMKMNKGFIKQKQDVSHPHEDVKRMKRLAERTRGSVKDLLDLKQKQVNIIEARASRNQVDGTAKQGTILMVFTTVSVVFLPLSFIASFFTIAIREFPQGNSGNSLPLAYVSSYLFGVGIPLALLCVIAALKLHKMRHLGILMWNWTLEKSPRIKGWVQAWGNFKEKLPWNKDDEELSENDERDGLGASDEELEQQQPPQRADTQPSYGLPLGHELAVLRTAAPPAEPVPVVGLRRAKRLEQMEPGLDGYWKSEKGPHRGAIFISVQ